jgi:hypothetical protein
VDIPKKTVKVVVKKHTVTIGNKPSPNNGGKAVETPIPVVQSRKGILGRCLEVIRDDLRRKKIETTALVKDPSKDWEEYKRFLELTKK